MSYVHGVRVNEIATSILAPRRISAGIPVWIGTAPTVKAADYGKAHLIYTNTAAAVLLGASSDIATYTLLEAQKVQFQLYRIAPAIFIPVAKVQEVTTAEDLTMAGDPAKVTVANTPIKPGTEVVKDTLEAVTYVRGTDYTIDNDTGEITRVASGDIGATDALKVTYSWYDPDNATTTEIIGGVDGEGNKTGIELAHTVITALGLVPGTLAAPGWSHNSTVALALAAAAGSITSLFKAQCCVDLDPTAVTLYSDAATAKTTGNLTDKHMHVCWPKVTYGGESHWLSTHLTCLLAWTDDEFGEGVPYVSPSNKRLVIDGATNNGTDVLLEIGEAEYLNGQGIITALNMAITGAGWVLYGGRTGAYPSSTDVKDNEIHNRRMFNWWGNEIILTYMQKVDAPVNRRLIDTVVRSLNLRLNGLTATGKLLGGRCEFVDDENPVTDVIDGKIVFHTWLTPPPRAREIDFYTEFDPDYIATLMA